MYGNNGNFYNNGFAPMGGTGMQFNGYPTPRTKQMNVLTAEEIAQLTKNTNTFSLALTETDKLQAACTHQKTDGTGDSLIEGEDGTVQCAICGYKFKPLYAPATTREVIQEAVDNICDVIQTTKLLYIDIDPAVAREFYQIIPLICKVPDLFEVAVKNYSKHENMAPWSNSNKNMNTMQMFQMLNSMISGGGQMYQQAPQQQPMGNMYYGQPNMMGAPMMQPGGMPSNGFGSYAPQTSGFSTAYGAEPQPVAAPQAAPVAGQQAPVEVTATTDGNTTNVAGNFKA